MLTRRGFTLIELMISIVVLGFVGVATTRMLRAMLGTSSAQVALATNQAMVRTGALAIPQEFREIGYDTIPLAGLATTDLEAIARHRITFRAMRGFGVTCGTPTLTEFRVRKPVSGLRTPAITDGFLLFLENDPNLGFDDQWAPMLVASIDYSSTCGADSAIAFTLAATVIVDPVTTTPMAISQHFVGGPIRWYERIEYGPYIDPGDGQAYVGVRSLSLGQATLSPIIGPLPDTTSFELEYSGADGSAIDPVTGSPLAVRAISLTLRGVTTAPVSLAGTSRRSRGQMEVVTSAALRNTLRP